jgi:acyl carrier protein
MNSTNSAPKHSDDSIYERLSRVFQRVFDEPGLILNEAMTAADVEQWDSLSHIDLIMMIEKEFRLRFTTGEIIGLKNVGALETLINRKLRR